MSGRRVSFSPRKPQSWQLLTGVDGRWWVPAVLPWEQTGVSNSERQRLQVLTGVSNPERLHPLARAGVSTRLCSCSALVANHKRGTAVVA